MNQTNRTARGLSRRDFMKTSAAVGAAAMINPVAFAQGPQKLRVGLIGCGGRGNGALNDCLEAGKIVNIPLEVVATADWFKHKAVSTGRGKGVPEERCFGGADAYKKLLETDVDVVLIATPPNFRPLQLEAAIKAGKHVFMEKPVAVDPVGIRSVLASSELAKQKGLAICAGTQRRHDPQYIEVMKRIHAGQIGDLLGGECYWVQGWVRQWGFWHERRPEWSDMEWQVRNWYYFTWLSGDHIVEQHVHNIDVTNWAMGTPPVQIMSLGGRQVRIEPEFGNIYDHFGVEFEYPNGTRVLSMARQIAGCTDIIGERIVGATGTARAGVIEGANPWTYTGPRPNPYEQEHADLIASIRAATPINEGRQVAESTLCAIAARMSAYTGREMKYDWVLKASKLDLSPKEYKFGPIPVAPVAVPGQTPLT